MLDLTPDQWKLIDGAARHHRKQEFAPQQPQRDDLPQMDEVVFSAFIPAVFTVHESDPSTAAEYAKVLDSCGPIALTVIETVHACLTYMRPNAHGAGRAEIWTAAHAMSWCLEELLIMLRACVTVATVPLSTMPPTERTNVERKVLVTESFHRFEAKRTPKADDHFDAVVRPMIDSLEDTVHRNPLAFADDHQIDIRSWVPATVGGTMKWLYEASQQIGSDVRCKFAADALEELLRLLQLATTPASERMNSILDASQRTSDGAAPNTTTERNSP